MGEYRNKNRDIINQKIREYRRNNKEKVHQIDKVYREKNKEKLKKVAKKWYMKHTKKQNENDTNNLEEQKSQNNIVLDDMESNKTEVVSSGPNQIENKGY